MKFKFTTLFLLILVTNSYIKAQPVNIKDSLALVDLYKDTGGKNWINSTNWLKEPVKTWYGITVNNSRVTQINLNSNNLKNSLPVSIANLTALTHLDLSENNLTGNIPDSIGNLINLYYLALVGNKLEGKIPASIGNLERLYELHLSYNYLSGSIPESICNLFNLFYVELQYNELSGKIPENIGNLFNLGNIKLNNNELTGHIPASFRNFESLDFFDLSYNELNGEFIFPAHNRIPCTIYLSHNHFTERKNVKPNKFFDLLGYTLAIDNNDYTFDGIEFLSQQYVQSYYAPQAQLTVHQNKDTLSVYAGGTLKNNTYTWFEINSHDSVVIVGDSVFQPSKSGQYYAKIINKYARQLILITDTINFIKSSIGNISANQIDQKLEIFPNPASNTLNIKELDRNMRYKIQITDEQGNIFIEKSIENVSAYTLNIQNLKAGIYYIYTLSDKNQNIKRKFIKE